MKTCKMWWLILAVLFVFVGCDTDTPQDSTEIQYSGETVYISKILSPFY